MNESLAMRIEQETAGTPTGTEATAALRGSPLFAEASDAEVAVLALSCRIERVAAGTVVIKEGEAASDLYLILGGELLSYSFDDLGRELALERLSDINQPVGEQALLRGARRSCSVRAVTDCHGVWGDNAGHGDTPGCRKLSENPCYCLVCPALSQTRGTNTRHIAFGTPALPQAFMAKAFTQRRL